MGKAESLEEHFNSFLVSGGVGTVATVASIAARTNDDVRDNNSAALNDFYLDFQNLSKTVSDLIAKLRANGLIQT